MRKSRRVLRFIAFCLPAVLFVFSLFVPIRVAAGDEIPSQLLQIFEKFGETYSHRDGDRFARALLHPYAVGVESGRYMDYEALRRLIGETWADMDIDYQVLSVEEDGCQAIIKVVEFMGKTKWKSVFVFVLGGNYGWRLIHYHSDVMM